MTRATRTSWLVGTLATTLLPGMAMAGGLSCSIGEVVLDHLQAGQRYSLVALAHLPLTITNTSDRPLRVRIESMVPDESELRHGAAAIPDAGWASASPETLTLAPRTTGQAELTLDIPNRDELLGRTFEAMFWSHSLPEPGEMLAYGLKSRVIFGVDSVRATPAPDAQPVAGDLSIALQPAEVHFDERATKDAPVSLMGADGKTLSIRNTSDHVMRVSLEALSPSDAETSLDAGYGDLTHVANVHIEEPVVTLEPGESRSVRASVAFAHGTPGKGKKFMCVVAASVEDLPVRTRILSRVYADAR